MDAYQLASLSAELVNPSREKGLYMEKVYTPPQINDLAWNGGMCACGCGSSVGHGGGVSPAAH